MLHYLRNIKFTVVVVAISLAVTACGGGGDGDAGGGGGGGAAFEVDCSSSSSYSPAGSPIVTVADNGSAATTIILMHGKTGAPNTSFMLQLASDLAADNYDVVAPYMPWSGLVWDGTMCEGMLYINQLAQAELTKGRNVVVMGHSMGAVHALIHDTVTPNESISGYVSIAPGHMPHRSRRIREASASSVTLAQQMVAAGNGDQFATFTTLGDGQTFQLSATANAFLSFHDLNVFPNINNVLPAIINPVLFLSGSTDPLTVNQNHAQLAAAISSGSSQYTVITGGHYTMLNNVPPVVASWLTGLGL